MPGFSYLQILCCNLVSVVGFVVIRFAVLKALIDVVLEAFEFLCVSFLASESAFLCLSVVCRF
jgi:hypothetical protein